MYLPAGTRVEARKMAKDHIHAAHKLSITTLVIYPDLKDSKWWLVIKPKVLNAAYKKDAEGKVSLMPNPHSELRLVSLMIRDGLSYNEILEVLPSLTEKQYLYIYGQTTRNVKN